MQEIFDQAAADQDKRRLGRTLGAKKGKPDFLILERSVAGAQGDKARLDAAEEILSANGMSSVTLDLLDFAIAADLLDRFRALAGEGVEAVQLLNGDQWLYGHERFNEGTISHAHALNIRRESLFEVPIKMLFWLSPDKIGDFMGEAADLFAWRGGIYVLSPGPVYEPDTSGLKLKFP